MAPDKMHRYVRTAITIAILGMLALVAGVAIA